MSSPPRDPKGDPAFAGSDAITHEPVVEEQRESPLPDPGPLRRLFDSVRGLLSGGRRSGGGGG